MLYLNTIGLQKDRAHTNTEEAQALAESLLKSVRSEAWENFLSDSHREKLFDFFMAHDEHVFRPATRALVYDYLDRLDQEYPNFMDEKEGEEFREILQAIDIIWQAVQAPVKELVAAGKIELKKHHGRADYQQFRSNAADMPELFGPTLALVDHYLNTELLLLLIQGHLETHHNLKSCQACLNRLKQELIEFSALANQFGFWSPPRQSKNPVLQGVLMRDVLAHC